MFLTHPDVEGSTPRRTEYSSNWSGRIRPTPKYTDSGRQKYQPLTDDAGIIEKLSVSSMPARSVASTIANSVPFSAWSGQAGYPGAGRMP